MPVRLLKPGLRTSEKFNRVSFMAQSGYVRLLNMVDDAGRYLANPKLLRSELFPLGDERGRDIPIARVETMLVELQSAGLIVLYESESKSYLFLTGWKEKVRTASRYPEPSKHLQTNDCKSSQMITSPPSPSPSPSPDARKRAVGVEVVDVLPEVLNSDEFKSAWERWHEHLKQKRRPATVHARELQLKKLAQLGVNRAIAALNHSIEKNWQGIYESHEHVNTGQTNRPNRPDRNAGTYNANASVEGLKKLVR